MEGVPGGVTSSSMLELDAKHLILAAVGERCVVAASAMTAAWVRGGATRRRGARPRGETTAARAGAPKREEGRMTNCGRSRADGQGV